MVRRAPPEEDLQQMLSWLVERQFRFNFKDGTPPITQDEVFRIYSRQEGRCALSGVPMVLDKAHHPESLAISRRDPEKPWTSKNTIVTVSALKPFVDKWGASYLVKVARRVMKLKDRQSKKEVK
jgi:hypothetical protein